jgi:TIR domain
VKVFIGWSGETSHQVALALHDWLPKVVQAVKPYVSSEDIAKGARWSSTIAGQLQTSSFGIICVTQQNSNSTWINFEAGALSKEIEKALVCPFLFDLKPSDVQGPLAQFQAVVNDEQDVKKLVDSINNSQPEPERLEKSMLAESFQVWWPTLKKRLAEIQREEGRPSPPRRDVADVLAELLDVSRSQQIDQTRILEHVIERQEMSARDQAGRLG